ncbi:methylmalonyl-CoA mutase, partial [Caulobacter sp. D4A]
MSEAPALLAADFGPPDENLAQARWLKLVEKTLKGADFDETLTRATPDGITIRPLYTAEDAVTVARDLRPRDVDRPWDLRTRIAHPDPRRAGGEILKDLENGAASVLLALDPTGEAGVAVGSRDDLARVL